LRRAAPPGAPASKIRYQLSQTPAAEATRFPAAPELTTAAPASPPATATLVSTFEQDLRWRWRVVKHAAVRIRYGITDSDADGTLGTICPVQLGDRPNLQKSSPPTTDLVLTVTKTDDRTTLRIEDEFFPPVPGLPQQLSSIVPKETWREITCQRAPVALSATSYQTLWEADVVRHSADSTITAHRRLRFVARLLGPQEPDDLQMLSDDDPVKTILPIANQANALAAEATRLPASAVRPEDPQAFSLRWLARPDEKSALVLPDSTVSPVGTTRALSPARLLDSSMIETVAWTEWKGASKRLFLTLKTTADILALQTATTARLGEELAVVWHGEIIGRFMVQTALSNGLKIPLTLSDAVANELERELTISAALPAH
ncbi:MAG: hypothetical protein RIQ79_963, partial [Verrucomicrobiota bacterium]